MAARTDGTCDGLLEFLNWAGRTEQMNEITARAWAASTRQVLGVYSAPGSLDVRTLDVEELLDRFEALHRLDYTPGSMTTYKSRFRQAVAAYLAWLDNEPWQPASRGGRRKRSDKTGAASAVPPKPPAQDTTGGVGADVPAPDHGSAPRLLNYTVPLRPNLMVTMSLPVDLSTADAKRIAAFVQSLAFDHDPPPRPAAETSS
jgi:hypothetical protein